MIRVEKLTKSYPTEKFGRYYVFRDLSFSLPTHTHVGVLGRNGAGKSTLLRLLSGVELPDRGCISIDGTISPPLGLANGFAGQISGRDNARFICRITGDSGAELVHRVAQIKEFSELGEFFERPVQTYSNGMRARLAFSINMSYRYDYYLIDELTAVGDKRFRDKATETFAAIKGQACVILASHNLQQLKNDCDVGLYVRAQGDVIVDDMQQLIKQYLRDQE